MMFSMDVEKMYTSLKRKEVKKEIRKILKEEEEFRGWKKVDIIKNLELVCYNTYGVVEDAFGKGKRMN